MIVVIVIVADYKRFTRVVHQRLRLVFSLLQIILAPPLLPEAPNIPPFHFQPEEDCSTDRYYQGGPKHSMDDIISTVLLLQDDIKKCTTVIITVKLLVSQCLVGRNLEQNQKTVLVWDSSASARIAPKLLSFLLQQAICALLVIQ